MEKENRSQQTQHTIPSAFGGVEERKPAEVQKINGISERLLWSYHHFKPQQEIHLPDGTVEQREYQVQDRAHLSFGPFLPADQYIADGEPHIFGDRLYLFGSHDHFNGKTFCEGDYVGWSAPLSDLSAWKYEGILYHKTQDPDNADGKLNLWAPDVAQGLDGRYYLYYCLANHPKLSVAVADTPCGPYRFLDHVRDAQGHILGTRPNDFCPFDPAILVDEGHIHLYLGQGPLTKVDVKHKAKVQQGVFHVELETDMVTLKTPPKPLIPNLTNSTGTDFEGHAFFEASSIRKFNQSYYFIYSSVQMHELCWAVSQKPDRDFVYGGVLISNGDLRPEDGYQLDRHGKADQRIKNYIGNNHGSVLELMGNYYVFYHRQTNRHMYSRQACVAPIHMTQEGRFLQAEMTSQGIGGVLPGMGSYGARFACQLYSSHGGAFVTSLAAQGHEHPTLTLDEGEPLQYIANLREGATAVFKYFLLGEAEKITISARGGSGKLVVRDSEGGKVLAAIPVQQSKFWHSFSAPFHAPEGVSALYMTWSGDKGLDLLQFTLQ